MTLALVLAAISDQVQMALIAAIAAAVTAFPAVIIALRGTNKKIEEKAVETGQKIKEVSLQIDGRLTQLLDEVAKAKHAEGVLAGIAQATEALTKNKVLDALIAVTPKATAQPTPAPAKETPVTEPVEIAVVSMPDQK